jgi:Bacterial low temperature requirement A protein (LtrA)
VLLAALIAMFLAALAVPGVLDDDGVLFGAAFLVVCAVHTVLYALPGRENPELLRAVVRLAPWTLLGATPDHWIPRRRPRTTELDARDEPHHRVDRLRPREALPADERAPRLELERVPDRRSHPLAASPAL